MNEQEMPAGRGQARAGDDNPDAGLAPPPEPSRPVDEDQSPSRSAGQSASQPKDQPASQPPGLVADSHPAASFFDRVGGERTFRTLVRRFYQGVATDPPLRQLYPEDDLGPAEERLTLFLIQYWGGPSTYSEQRGHPRLRLRHAPFQVDVAARDRWLTHMRTAVLELGLAPADETELWQYLERAAHFMVNA